MQGLQCSYGTAKGGSGWNASTLLNSLESSIRRLRHSASYVTALRGLETLFTISCSIPSFLSLLSCTPFVSSLFCPHFVCPFSRLYWIQFLKCSRDKFWLILRNNMYLCPSRLTVSTDNEFFNFSKLPNFSDLFTLSSCTTMTSPKLIFAVLFPEVLWFSLKCTKYSARHLLQKWLSVFIEYLYLQECEELSSLSFILLSGKVNNHLP